MEKHKCKLCFRNFSNGRALGGHMRSHMVNLPVPPKQTEEPPLAQLSFEAESAPSSSSSSEEEEDDDKGISYGLRDNPKRSIRFVDPEFSFAVIESSSVIPQDRESETESSMNPTRRRSKRPWNQYDHLHHHHYHHHRHDHHHHHYKQIQEQDAFKKQKSTNKVISSSNNNHNNNNKTESCWAEPEPVSSISDATTEEDVAFCLMMLSRDKWKRQKDQEKEQEEDNGEEEDDDDDDDEDDEAERSLEDSDEFSEELKSSKTTRSVRGKYKCETCKKVFRSYQALGGHRASHKKIKVPPTTNNTASYEPEMEQEKKIHECPVCFRVFASGQALGGHKRTHVTGSSSTSVRTSTKFADNNFIDLNLPAPIDDDDVSQIENSAVSDAEFLKPNTRTIDAQAA